MTAPRKPNRRIACAIVALGFSVMLPGTAFAQEVSKDYPPCTKKTSPSDLRAAKGAHETATAFSERGDYDNAIQFWRDAYALDCTAHAELINIANAYEKKGDRAAALTALKTYQQRISKPDETIAERITKLNEALSKATPKAPPSAAPDSPPAAPVAAPTIASNVALPAFTVSDSPSRTTGRPFGITPWLVVGAGGAMAVVGAIMLPVGLGAVSSAKSACGGNACADASEASKGNTGRTEIGVGGILAAVGVAAIGGGLGWQFFANKPAKPPTSANTGTHTVHLEFTPDFSPRHSSLVLNGTF